MTKRAAVKTLRSTLFYAGAVALCVGPLFVFVWMIMTGLKTGVQNIAYPPKFIFRPTLENFRAVFQQHHFFRYLINSLIIATLATGLFAGAGAAGGLFHRQVPAGQDRNDHPAGPHDAVRELPAALVHHLPVPETDRHVHGADPDPPDHHPAHGGLADGHLFRKHAGRAGRRGHDRWVLPLEELSHHRAAPGPQRHRHLGHHGLHFLLEPVPFLADPFRPADQNCAGGRVQLHLLRQDRLGRHRGGRHPDRAAGFGVCLLRAQDHRAGADDGGFEGLV